MKIESLFRPKIILNYLGESNFSSKAFKGEVIESEVMYKKGEIKETWNKKAFNIKP